MKWGDRFLTSLVVGLAIMVGIICLPIALAIIAVLYLMRVVKYTAQGFLFAFSTGTITRRSTKRRTKA